MKSKLALKVVGCEHFIAQAGKDKAPTQHKIAVFTVVVKDDAKARKFRDPRPYPKGASQN